MYDSNKNRGYLIIIFIAIFKNTGWSFPLYLGVLDASLNVGLNRNLSNTFLQTGDYLVIHNGRRFCEGGSILHATDQIKVEDALTKCNESEGCSFFCQTGEKEYNVNGSRKVGNMIERVLSKDGDGIPRSSVNWLCSGDNWGGLFVKKGWMTAVKGDYIRKTNPLFTFSMNTQAECESGNLLDSAKNLSLKSSCEMCKNMKTCTFFTLSFVLDEKMTSFSTITKFCKGAPSNLKGNDGNLLAVLIEVDKEASKKSENISKGTSMPLYYYGGPITSDHYYDDLKRGSLVPATKL